ncbi:MAG TPA: pyridoxamine 5'-phosphate oxidase family protein [Anaerolineales bacterium]|nr:pyridoxamine 5'-phosphate oxidase family protein [Anaerolineales bacterium]
MPTSNVLSRRLRTFLSKPRLARLCTIDPKGFPHVVPVDFMRQGDEIVFGTDAGEAKMRNPLPNPKGRYTCRKRTGSSLGSPLPIGPRLRSRRPSTRWPCSPSWPSIRHCSLSAPSYVLHGWPRPLLMFATVALLVPAMTYTIMPWVTRLFRSWLYPASRAG